MSRRIHLDLEKDLLAFAAHEAKRGGYFGTADYLNALLSAALIREQAKRAGQARTARNTEHSDDPDIPF